MGLFSRFENKMEDTLEGAANKMFDAPISPVQIAKKCEKQMRRETMVGAGKQFAPTLYTILVNPGDDERLFGYYPTLAGETETYLSAKAAEEGLVMDGQPLVRFVVDETLKHGKFDVIAEAVAAPIIAQLREEELVRYGIVAAPAKPQPASGYAQQVSDRASRAQARPAAGEYGQNAYAPEAVHAGYAQQNSQNLDDPALVGYAERAGAPARKPPLPYVPEEEIDYSIDYGQYTFDSEDFEDYRSKAEKDRRNRAMYGTSQPLEQDRAARRGGAPAVAPIPVGGAAMAPAAPRPDDGSYATRSSNSLPLAGAHITLGRGTGNDIVVQDSAASRRHAELRLSPQGYWTLTDMGSTNGTLVNGAAITVQTLQNGDTFTIGKTNFQFVVG